MGPRRPGEAPPGRLPAQICAPAQICTPPARRSPSARPAPTGRLPAGPGCSPPAQHARARRAAVLLPGRGTPAACPGVAHGKPAARHPPRPRARAPRACTPIPPYTRVQVDIRRYTDLCTSAYMQHMGSAEAPGSYLCCAMAHRCTPPHPQHNCSKRLYIDSMSPFPARRKCDVSAEK